MNKINLLDYVDPSWRVVINDNFKQKLRTKIKQQKITVRKISEITGASQDSIWKFHQDEQNVKLDYLQKLCKFLGIDETELQEDISEIYVGVQKSSFRIKTITIDEEFAAWWGVWIGEGDHSKTREAISLTNYEVNLLHLHINVLELLNFPRNKISAEIVTNRIEPKEIIKQRWSEILNLPKEQIPTVTFMERASQEGARVQVWCASLFRILHLMDDEVKRIIKNSSEEVKIAYIRGIFAAEGSVRRAHVRINMKNQKEINFIKEILSNLGVNTPITYLNSLNECYELSIFGYDYIKRFIDIDGFKLHSKRREKLHEVFKYYEKKLPDYIRFERVKSLLLDTKEITNN